LRPPPEDFYKINSDGAFNSKTKSGGWGFVVRNSLGGVLLAAAGNIAHVDSAIQSEAIAAFKSIQQVTQLDMQHIILEMDASVLGRAIKASGVDHSPIACLVNHIRDIKRLEFFHVCDVPPLSKDD
jgi:ribonuclease HI